MSLFLCKGTFFFGFRNDFKFLYLQISQKSSTFALVIELERHIEILLLSNDCVIVPNLGGFMTHHIEARYDEQEQVFLPPQRTLGFNPQLKLNDSLLAQSYVEAHDISYPEALRRIEDEVTELKHHLNNEGFYELNDIGRLAINDEGNMEFEPCEAGILTPELYGLSSFEVAQLAQEQSVFPAKRKNQDVHSADNINDSNNKQKERAITIKMSWIRNTAAAAAALLTFFMMTTPVENSEQTNVNLSQVNLPLISKDTNQKKQAVLEEQATKTVPESKTEKEETAEPAEVVEQTEQVQPVEVVEPQPFYCIVMASHVSQPNAEEFVRKLQQLGIDDARVYINDNIRRVVCGNFATETEAYKHLQDIHLYPSLADAWVYRVQP